VITIIHIGPIERTNIAAPVIVAGIVIMPVIGMTGITVMVDMQVVIPPAEGECGGYAPEITGSEVMIGSIGIIVNRVSGGIVVIDRLGLVDNHFFRHVVRHVDNRFTCLGDDDGIIVAADFLKAVGFQISGGIGELAK
jgi:hypothetical protein